MRSTRGRTRADVKRASQPKPLMTDAARITAPLRSNAPTHDPGNAQQAARVRAGFGKQHTMLQLSRGGFSSYYRSREGWGYSK